jgi:hypothetical protein
MRCQGQAIRQDLFNRRLAHVVFTRLKRSTETASNDGYSDDMRNAKSGRPEPGMGGAWGVGQHYCRDEGVSRATVYRGPR